VQTALRLLALDPLQESVHRTLMRLYLRLGRRGAGLRQYQACLDLLRRELDAEPEDQTRRLYLELLQSPATPDTAADDGGAGAAIHPAPLLGREADLARLGRAYQRARDGIRPAIAIVGEAGIGKTRLVEEFIATLSSRDVRVFPGRAYESEADLAFGLWIHLLRDAGVPAEAARLLNDRPWARPEIARLLPELADAGHTPNVSADRGLLFEAVGQLMAGLSRSDLLLVLEDAHWADEPSLRLLAFLLRRIPRGRLVVILSAREEEMSGAPALRQVLAELGRDELAVTLAVAPLGREAATALARSLARGGHDAAQLESRSEEIWRVSEGNAFMVVETVRALQEGGQPRPLADLPLPRRVHDTISGRLDRLTDRSRGVVAVAAAIGRQFEFAVLRDSAAIESAEAAGIVEELVGRRILHVVGERLDFP
jgi:predicted ATPase